MWAAHHTHKQSHEHLALVIIDTEVYPLYHQIAHRQIFACMLSVCCLDSQVMILQLLLQIRQFNVT